MKAKTNSSNVIWHHATVTRERRMAQNKHRSVVLWFTGLSGAGKSTLAHATEDRLHQLGCRTFVLDGDNVRHGLCGDLGFSLEDRKENIRRIAQVAKLMVETGVIVMTAFISPMREDRAAARRIIPQGEFLEVFCDSPLDSCERRDVKGLYRKARAGMIPDFTGISSPYEPPVEPELKVASGDKNIDECVVEVLELLRERGVIPAQVGLAPSDSREPRSRAA